MKRSSVLLVVAALAAPAIADRIKTATPGAPVPPPAAALRGDLTAYSNMVNATGYGYTTTSGATVNAVGDDLVMAAGGRLNTVGFSIWNSDDLLRLVSVDLQISFYNGTQDPNGNWVYDTLAGSFSLQNHQLNGGSGLNAGDASFESVANLGPQNIHLAERVIAVLQITNLQGGSTSAGQLVYDPPTIGSSERGFWQNGAYGYSFGAPPNPPGNFAWEIGVPEPASAVLLALTGLLIRRR